MYARRVTGGVCCRQMCSTVLQHIKVECHMPGLSCKLLVISYSDLETNTLTIQGSILICIFTFYILFLYTFFFYINTAFRGYQRNVTRLEKIDSISQYILFKLISVNLEQNKIT